MTTAGNLKNLGATPQPINNLFPTQPRYQRPDQASDRRPPRIVAAAKRFDGAPAEAADAAIRHAADAFQSHLGSIDTDSYSASGVKEQIAAFQGTAAYQAVDTAVQKVNDAADAAIQRVADVRDSLATDGDTATELRAVRFWNRTKGVLDSLKDGSALTTKAQTLVADASPEDRSTLVQELPDYLTSRGAVSDWLDAALSASVPHLAHALADQTLAGKARDVTNWNAQQLRDRVTQTSSLLGYRPPTFVALTAVH